jgi:hypothetical protein
LISRRNQRAALALSRDIHYNFRRVVGRMFFQTVGEIHNIEIIAVDAGIREVSRLRRKYGIGRWRKLKGIALVRLEDGSLHKAEIHWYEAHGVGRREFKIKRFLDQDR